MRIPVLYTDFMDAPINYKFSLLFILLLFIAGCGKSIGLNDGESYSYQIYEKHTKDGSMALIRTTQKVKKFKNNNKYWTSKLYGVMDGYGRHILQPKFTSIEFHGKNVIFARPANEEYLYRYVVETSKEESRIVFQEPLPFKYVHGSIDKPFVKSNDKNRLPAIRANEGYTSFVLSDLGQVLARVEGTSWMGGYQTSLNANFTIIQSNSSFLIFDRDGKSLVPEGAKVTAFGLKKKTGIIDGDFALDMGKSPLNGKQLYWPLNEKTLLPEDGGHPGLIGWEPILQGPASSRVRLRGWIKHFKIDGHNAYGVASWPMDLNTGPEWKQIERAYVDLRSQHPDYGRQMLFVGQRHDGTWQSVLYGKQKNSQRYDRGWTGILTAEGKQLGRDRIIDLHKQTIRQRNWAITKAYIERVQRETKQRKIRFEELIKNPNVHWGTLAHLAKKLTLKHRLRLVFERKPDDIRFLMDTLEDSRKQNAITKDEEKKLQAMLIKAQKIAAASEAQLRAQHAAIVANLQAKKRQQAQAEANMREHWRLQDQKRDTFGQANSSWSAPVYRPTHESSDSRISRIRAYTKALNDHTYGRSSWKPLPFR